ncbi:MAG: rhodanese-like protein [Marmoricola sp.]|nr:rhodanese-like protein [Marmoricola sp.]
MNGIPAVTIDLLPDPLPADLVVLDVREPVEWAHGRIDGAIHIPLGQLVDRVGELPEGQTLVVCKVGARSAQATGYLVANGRDAINLDGGMLEWATGGRPMVSDAGEPVVV